MDETIYAKTYPSEKYLWAETDEDVATMENTASVPEELFQKLYQNMKLAEIPGRKEQGALFIQRAIQVSKFNHLDILIRRSKLYISVRFSFDAFHFFQGLPALAGMADDINFFSRKEEEHRIMHLEYYTYSLYYKDHRVLPVSGFEESPPPGNTRLAHR